ncbi:uncharacterized protein VP01_4160g1, partial [Puccinia sorghi]
MDNISAHAATDVVTSEGGVYITEVPAVLTGAAADAVNKNPSATLTKLQEIVHLEAWKTRTAVVSKRSEKLSEEQSDAAEALMHKPKKGKKRNKHVYCAPGKHNPEAKSHDAEHCWQLHPEQRPSSKSNGSSSNQAPTTQLVEVEDGHESE